MKIKPYFVWLADTYIIGPCVSLEMGQTRIGLSLVGFEVGLGIDVEKLYSFGCNSCGAIGHATVDHLPEGWEKRHRPDHTYYFLCPKCKGFEQDEDYVIDDENREKALDEILGQFSDQKDNKPHFKACRDYAVRLLEEGENWSKYELADSVAAFADGVNAGMKMVGK